MTTLYNVRFSPRVPVYLALILAFGIIAESNAQTLSASRAAVDSARFSVAPTSIAFGTVKIDSTVSKTLTVTNAGTSPLIISSVGHVAISSSEVTVSPTTATIAAGGNQIFTVTFAPKNAGAKGGALMFTHNANNVKNNTTLVQVSGLAPTAITTTTAPAGTNTFTPPGIRTTFRMTVDMPYLFIGVIAETPRIPILFPLKIGPAFNSTSSVENAKIAGSGYTTGDQLWEFSSSQSFTGSTDITFDNPYGNTARIVRRPVGSGPEVSWDLVPIASTSYGSGTITATNMGGFLNQWTLVTPGVTAPTLTTLSITQGAKGANYNVVLTGTNFTLDSLLVSFGAGITVNSKTLIASTDLAVNITVSPTATAGTRDVALTTIGGTVTKTAAFTVVNAAPTFVSVNPTSGAKGATLNVVLTGTGFETGITSVNFGTGITVNLLTVTSTTQATANVTISGTATAGTRDVIVTNAAPGGGSVTLTGGFTVGNLAPSVASIFPTTGIKGSIYNFTVNGTNFASGVTTAVSFGAGITVNSFTIASATKITGNITIDAAAATGMRDITVTNTTPGGGIATLTGAFNVTTGTPVDVETPELVIPKNFVLEEVFPNPFNPSTTIRFGLPERSNVKIEVYSVLGKLIATLAAQEMQHGFHQINWKADNVASGTYLVRMTAESVESGMKFTTSRKAVLLK